MIALIKKELTDKWHFALYGFLLMIPIYFYTYDGIDQFQAPKEIYNRMATSELALFDFMKDAPYQGTVLFLALGFFLGCSIMFEERKPMIWHFLAHREIKAIHVVLSKFIAGSILFLIPSLIYIAAQLYWFNFEVLTLYSLSWTLLLPYLGPVYFGWIMFLVGFTMFLPGIPVGFRGLSLIGSYVLMGTVSITLSFFYSSLFLGLFIGSILGVTLLLWIIFRRLVSNPSLSRAWILLIYCTSLLGTIFLFPLNPLDLNTTRPTLIKWHTFTFEGVPVEMIGSPKERRAISLLDGKPVPESEDQLCELHTILVPIDLSQVHTMSQNENFLMPLKKWPGGELFISYLPGQSLVLLTDAKVNREGYLGGNGFHRFSSDCTPFPRIERFIKITHSYILDTKEGYFLWRDPKKPPMSLNSFEPQAWGEKDDFIFLFNGKQIAMIQNETQVFTYFETPPELENALFMRVSKQKSGLGIFTLNHTLNRDVPRSDTSVFATILKENSAPELNLFIEIGSDLQATPSAMQLALLPYHDFISGLNKVRFSYFYYDEYESFSDWRFWITMLLKHILFASLFTWYRFKYEPSKGRLFSEFLGIIAFGFMFMISIWLFYFIRGHARCPVCKAKRILIGQTCPACNKAWPEPATRSIDLFHTEPMKRNTEA